MHPEQGAQGQPGAAEKALDQSLGVDWALPGPGYVTRQISFSLWLGRGVESSCQATWQSLLHSPELREANEEEDDREDVPRSWRKRGCIPSGSCVVVLAQEQS